LCFNLSEEKTKEVNVHRIITTSFNVKLNPFIANNEPKKSSFETVRTGGIKEIRVNRTGTNLFNYYAYRLTEFRDNIFQKSYHWKFPVHSFISEIDCLVEFYHEVLKLTSKYDYSKGNYILENQLLLPLREFLFSLDEEFGIDYFSKKIGDLKINYARTPCEITIRVTGNNNKPKKGIAVKLYEFTEQHPRRLCSWGGTDKYGYVSFTVPEGTFEVEVKKCDFNQVYQIKEDTKISVIAPKMHWW